MAIPVAYDVLKNHPGDGFFVLDDEYDTVPAADVVHYFRCDRPGQIRGIPDIAPALPLFAQLRRFTLAVLAAAETAAEFAGILYTDAPANGEADAAEPFEPIELEKRMLLTMPGGWKMSQMKSEQTESTRIVFFPMLDWIRSARVFAGCFLGQGGSAWINKIRTKTTTLSYRTTLPMRGLQF